MKQHPTTGEVLVVIATILAATAMVLAFMVYSLVEKLIK